MTRSISKFSSSSQLEESTVWQSEPRDRFLQRYPDVREPELHQLIIRDIIDVQVRDVMTTSAASDRAGRGAKRGRSAAAGPAR